MKEDKEELENSKEILSDEKVKTGEVASTFFKPDENIEDDIEKYPEPPEVISKLKAARERADEIVVPTTKLAGNTSTAHNNTENNGTFQKDIKDIKNKAQNRTKKAEAIEQDISDADIEKTR